MEDDMKWYETGIQFRSEHDEGCLSGKDTGMNAVALFQRPARAPLLPPCYHHLPVCVLLPVTTRNESCCGAPLCSVDTHLPLLKKKPTAGAVLFCSLPYTVPDCQLGFFQLSFLSSRSFLQFFEFFSSLFPSQSSTLTVTV